MHNWAHRDTPMRSDITPFIPASEGPGSQIKYIKPAPFFQEATPKILFRNGLAQAIFGEDNAYGGADADFTGERQLAAMEFREHFA